MKGLAVLLLGVATLGLVATQTPEKRRTGNTCSSDAECPDNAFCKQNAYCVCKDNYVFTHLTPTDKVCLKVVKFGGVCMQDIQCQAELGIHSYCQNGICKCHENSHLDGEGCYENALVGEQCRFDKNCYLGEGREKTYCIRGYCNCDYRYSPRDNGTRCVRDSGLGEACEDEFQCAGAGLTCVEGICKCRDYWIEQQQTQSCLPRYPTKYSIDIRPDECGSIQHSCFLRSSLPPPGSGLIVNIEPVPCDYSENQIRLCKISPTQSEICPPGPPKESEKIYEDPNCVRTTKKPKTKPSQKYSSGKKQPSKQQTVYRARAEVLEDVDTTDLGKPSTSQGQAIACVVEDMPQNNPNDKSPQTKVRLCAKSNIRKIYEKQYKQPEPTKKQPEPTKKQPEPTKKPTEPTKKPTEQPPSKTSDTCEKEKERSNNQSFVEIPMQIYTTLYLSEAAQFRPLNPNKDPVACEAVKAIGDRCEFDIQCYAFAGTPLEGTLLSPSLCLGGLCACAYDARLVGGLCWTKRRPGEKCKMDEECVSEEDEPGYCLNGRCTCKTCSPDASDFGGANAVSRPPFFVVAILSVAAILRH